MTGLSIEATLELWASSLRAVKARIRPLFTQEVVGGAPFGFAMKLDIGKLARPVDGDKQIELALGRLNLGNVDMKIADRIRFERFPGRLVAFDLGQAADPVTLQASDAGTSASASEWSVAARRGNRRVAATYTAGRRR